MKASSKLCIVNHPHLKGVVCDHKQGHSGWHRAVRDHWDESERILFWGKGRGKKNRATGSMVVTAS